MLDELSYPARHAQPNLRLQRTRPSAPLNRALGVTY